jgi:sugar lactone lactonase YvrE
MSHPLRLKSALAGAIVAVGAIAAVQVGAQNGNLPTPYHEVANWAKLPAGAKWAGVISVDPAANGDVWVFHRSDPPIIRFDQSGKAVKSFGDGMFVLPHGMTVDRDGNVWVTDAQLKDGKGNQVFKFSPDGTLLMTLGKAGVAGGGNDVFSGPCDVAIAQNGDIFVADGHIAEVPVNRIMKFSKDGTFIKAWGKRGSGPGEFDTPHSIAIDSRGRIFVADRSNSRIQIFDQDGRFLDQWKQFGRPSGVFIDKNDTIYVADSQSNSKQNPSFTRGIRIGSAKDGKVTAMIPFVESDPEKNNNAGVEGVAADEKGNLYAAEVSTEMLKKYLKQ